MPTYIPPHTQPPLLDSSISLLYMMTNEYITSITVGFYKLSHININVWNHGPRATGTSVLSPQ